MKSNENTKLNGKRVVLVPYEKKHVLRYHEWMQGEELQQLTASEPLTLDEEYDMQQSWRNDENKCTFIILSNEGFDGSEESELENMVGDVNLFFNDEDDPSSAELEIMIAEPTARGKGLGKEALFSMMRYGVEDLNLDKFTAKIGYSNEPSLKMFTKIGFQEISRSDVFKEVTLELKVTEAFTKRIHSETSSYIVCPY